MQVTIKEVVSSKELKTFYQFQNKLYKGCKEYVPTLDTDQKSTLTSDAALEYCTRKMWLAYKGNKPVGRIQAIVNPKYNEKYNTKKVRFGWFDFEEDINIAEALLKVATEWGKSQGMNEIHGPLAYNALGRQGMLIKGFENTPPTNCLYNFPYYVEYMKELGYEKEVDWIQYKINPMEGTPDKLIRIHDLLIKRYNLKLLDISKLKGTEKDELVKKFFKLYNECFENVPNFVSFTDAEIAKTGKLYFKMLRPELTCLVMDEQNEIAAFGLCLPSLSESFKKAKGKLFPFGWYHILKEFNHYKTIDLMIVGSSSKWASKGLSAVYHAHLASNFQKYKISCAITNPQADTNIAAIKVWDSYNNELFMRRRSWCKSI